MNLLAHFTFLAFKILTLWLSYVDVMLASFKLEISPAMPHGASFQHCTFYHLS
jgi:hypothetical protein